MPWFYQDEISEFLFEAFGITVTQSTICKALKRIKITRKKMRVNAVQRNPELCMDWRDQLQFYTPEQLLFVDECGSNERTGNRQYGYAKAGIKPIVDR